VKAAVLLWIRQRLQGRKALSEIERARMLISAIDRGGIPLNPARVNAIARDLGPPRQNSCRLSMMLKLGATRMRDGSVRRSIQEQGGGAVVAAGERPSGRGITRDRGFGADIGTMA